MGEVKAGVVLVTKFVKPGSKVYSGYIDYIDRDEAVRNEHSDKWNQYYHKPVKDQYSDKWSGYVVYMDDPEKTTDLFSSGADHLTNEQKQQLKQDFISAQERGNLMWQTVISFDNRWLEEQGLYDSATHTVNADKLKELTRNCMKKMLEKEKIAESAVWSAAIHYNTDNIHIHIATVEPGKTQRPMREDGEPKGTWRQSTINAGKASVVNNIIMQQEENRIINDLIRNNIVGVKRERTIAYDKDLRQAFLKVYYNLPADKRYWNYNSTNLGNQNRKYLDELSRLYIKKFHKEDFERFRENVKKQQDKYEKAYGKGEKIINRYAENKEKELYNRLGNAILKEMKAYDKRLATEEHQGKGFDRRLVNDKLSGDLDNKMLADHNIRFGLHTVGHAMDRINKAFRKNFQSMKNLAEYEKLQQKIEQQKKEQNMNI